MNGAKIAAAIAGMLKDRVAVGVADPTQPANDLWPDEAITVVGAISSRKAEFAAGRRAARMALGQLGLAECSIPVGTGRSPVWPEGVVGSITHVEGIALAAVSRSHQGIGIDIEAATPLDDDLTEVICTPTDIAWLGSLPKDQRGRAAKKVFCAKEAFFKAQFPLTGAMIDFQAVSLQFTDSWSFAVVPTDSTSGLPAAQGHVSASGRFFLAVAWLV